MNDIEDRARRLLGGPWSSALPTRSDAPGVVRVAMNCSVDRQPFVVVAECRGDTLVMLRNELISGGHGVGPVMAPAALGTLRFDGGMWSGCPHCGAQENHRHHFSGLWCCARCGGFNCAGSDARGRFNCSCGATVADGFTPQAYLEVRGYRESAQPARQSSAALPASGASLPDMPRAASPTPQYRAINAPPVPRLPRRG